VEYSLIVALFLVVAVGALQFLSTESEEATAVQIDCVEQRPPVASCQLPAIVTTTTDSVPITTTPPPPEPEGEASAPGTALVPTTAAGATSWSMSWPITLVDEFGEPLIGAEATVSVVIPGVPIPVSKSCVSDSSGVCTITFDSAVDAPPGVNPASITISVQYILSTPAINTYPAAVTVSKPV
jgi:hypothetical protein